MTAAGDRKGRSGKGYLFHYQTAQRMRNEYHRPRHRPRLPPQCRKPPQQITLMPKPITPRPHPPPPGATASHPHVSILADGHARGSRSSGQYTSASACSVSFSSGADFFGSFGLSRESRFEADFAFFKDGVRRREGCLTR